MKSTSKFLFLILAMGLAAGGCQKHEEQSSGQKAEAGPPHDANIVVLSAENLKHVALTVEPVTLGNLDMTLKATGRVSANLNKTAKVTSTFEGRLTQLNFDLNDRVKAGEVIALVEAPELLGKPLELKAPIDGVIFERKAVKGELVDKSTVICTISEPAQLWVIAEVKERDIAALKVGQDATFRVLAYPQETFRGKVILIGNDVEAASRTVEVRIAADNSDGRLKPGMFADTEIVTTVIENVLLISDAALQTEGEQQIVFVARDGTTFEKRLVKLGLEQQGRVQALEGVKVGEKVVTIGSFILKSEMLKSEMEAD